MDCCLAIEANEPTKKIKIIATVFTFLELIEFLRVVCITEWLLTPRWEKTVIIEIVFLVLLMISNLLLYLGAVRHSPTKLMTWLFLHLIALLVQIILVVYFVIVLFIIASPQTQNSWLGLPSGMSSNTSEFQQALRYQLGASVSKLIALMIVTPITALSCKSVWKVKQNFEAELQNKQAKYQIKAEYKDTSPHPPSNPSNPSRRNSTSLSLYRDQAGRKSYRRSHSEDIYTLPQTDVTQVPGPDYRGAQHHDPAQLWSRQTSMDTSYNVPSIRTDMGDNMASLGQRNYGRFDSIAEVTESSQGGWRNNGYNL